MRIWRGKRIGLRRDERGFTLPELLTTIAILGILLAIAMVIWNSIIEARRVDSAANQLASDMRLAHSGATNQLTSWRVVLEPGRADENEGADYHLVRLNELYETGDPAPSTPLNTPPKPRTFEGDVEIMNISGLLDTSAADWAIAPTVADQTRTLEFDSDGSMNWYQAVSASTCVRIDGGPELVVTALSATSRVEIKEQSCV